MPRQFFVPDVKNREQALKKARARISRLNKSPKGYKGAEVKLVSLKKTDKKNYYLATIKKK